MKVLRRMGLLDLAIVAGWIVAAATNYHDMHAVVPSLGAALAWFEVAHLRLVVAGRPTTSRPRSEPSSDARQWARAVTDLRNALIAEGTSPDDASKLIATWLGTQMGSGS